MPLFLESEDGRDWYECQPDFADDTVKLMYDTNGVIHSVVDKPVPRRGNILAVSMLFPVDMSVAEITALPDGFETNSKSWFFIDGKVLQIIDYVAEAERKKSQLIAAASQVIIPLQDALDTGSATDAQIQLLLKWKAYRLALSRIDTSLAPDIIWPEQPEGDL